ncbi:cysteine hydrolase family protein [Janibacter endophyticus]|uniref:cysteine hydrolase family protein n=1 Tax=Janibacter endophyticus TaxID=2806261 RepID=UPI0027DD5F39|nr:isochorismatase family protein [Janibacter endophyticus]
MTDEGVAAAPPSPPALPDLADAWLLVVDPQRIFADPESDWGSPMFGDIIAPVHRLAERVGPRRTLVTRWVPGTSREGSWADYFRAWPFADRPDDDPMFALVGQAEELTARATIDVSTFGKWGEELTDVVGPTPTLLVTGVSTDCCVLSTVLPAADAGARVVVVTDGCAGSTPENHAAALHVMGLYPPQVTLATSADVLAGLP